MPDESPWKIDLAIKRGQGVEGEVREINLQRFTALQRFFLGLAVKLKYKVSVSRKSGAESEGFPGFHDQNIFYSVSDDVILHSVAASCLLSVPRAVDFHELLQTIELSLRANQIMAIGLRGLLKRPLSTSASSYFRRREMRTWRCLCPISWQRRHRSHGNV